MSASKQKITTFLAYESQAEEAAKLYVSLFPNSRIGKVLRWGEGGQAPKGSVLTIEFELDGQQFVAMNGGPHFKLTDAISLSVDCTSQEEIDHYWTKLAADGGKEVQCGWVTDRFGVSWQIVPSVLPDLLRDPDPAKAKRTMDAMVKMKKLVIADLQKAHDGR
jgi:predicted 3-demethylubiquinone-9 3-methyltransferase (glyoxalase superfamily)